MTKNELEDMLHVLGLDEEAEANLVYVFFTHSDGRVDNFSIAVRRGRAMSDKELVKLMKREYPSTRDGDVIRVERPKRVERPNEWMDVYEVCKLLKVSERTVRAWSREGLLKPCLVHRRVYYNRRDIDELVASNIVQENGRLDRTGVPSGNKRH